MGWITPLDWTGITNDIVTGAQLNQQIRDNLNVLSSHAHTGAAGMGGSTLNAVALTSIVGATFADQSANPDAAGELQRNGNDLLWYGSSVVNMTAADAAADTPSLRTLSTTSTTAAAGNHTHVPASQAVGIDDDNHEVVDTASETTVATLTATPGAAGRAWVLYGVMAFYPDTPRTITARIKYDGTTLEERAGLEDKRSILSAAFQASPTVASHTITLTVERTATSGSHVTAFGLYSAVGFREVSL